MLTSSLDKKYYFIYTALVFLALGLMTSPTIVAGYHIFIAVPALLLFWQNKKDITLPKSSWFLISLALWALASAGYNLESLQRPFKSFQEVKYYLFAVICIFPLIYFTSFNIKRHLRVVLNILCITIIIAFFVGISKAWFLFDPVKMEFGKFHDRSGGFVNYMRYGYASSLLFILGLGITFNREKLKEFINPKLFYPALVFCLLAIGTSQTRGALLALLVGLPVLLFWYQRKLSVILVLLGAVFAGVIIYFSFYNQSTKYRFINVNQGSNAVRVSQWKTAVAVMKERPIFGLGPDQFSYNVKEYKKKNNIKYDYYSGHAHNIFLEHGASYGFAGLGFLLLFLLFWFYEMIKLKSALGFVVSSYIVAFFVGGQVENLFDVINSHILFFVYSLSQAYSLKKAQI